MANKKTALIGCRAALLVCVCITQHVDAMSTVHGCPERGLAAGHQSIIVESTDVSRAVRVFIPSKRSAPGGLPLVINLHGSGSSGEEQSRLTRFADVADKHGFVVAHPDGGVSVTNAAGGHAWNIPGVPLAGGGATPASAADDVQFIADLIDAIAATICIDKRRVYVTGFSGGGRMTSLLACRLSTRIAAVAPVAGLRAGLPSSEDSTKPDPATCQPQRAVPIITFHGTSDAVNPYEGGGTPYWKYGIPAALQRWAALNGCKGGATESRIADHVTRVNYDRCHAPIVLYRIDAPGAQGGGHSWPGAMPASADQAPRQSPQDNAPSVEINASELIWRFFEQQSLAVSLSADL